MHNVIICISPESVVIYVSLLTSVYAHLHLCSPVIFALGSVVGSYNYNLELCIMYTLILLHIL